MIAPWRKMRSEVESTAYCAPASEHAEDADCGEGFECIAAEVCECEALVQVETEARRQTLRSRECEESQPFVLT